MKTLHVSLVPYAQPERHKQRLQLEVKEDDRQTKLLQAHDVCFEKAERGNPSSLWNAEVDREWDGKPGKLLTDIDTVTLDSRIVLRLESVSGSAKLDEQRTALEVRWEQWGEDWLVTLYGAHVLDPLAVLADVSAADPLPDLQAERKAHLQTLRKLVQLGLAADSVVLAPELNARSPLSAEALAQHDAQKLLQLRTYLAETWLYLQPFDFDAIKGES